MRVFSPEDARQIVESAFTPFECVVQFGPYKESLGFQVKDASGKPLLTREGLRKAAYRDARELTLDIEIARENLIGQGFILDRWTPPV